MHRMYRMYTHNQGGWFVPVPYLRVIICVMALILTSCGSVIVDTFVQTVPKPTATVAPTPTPTQVTPAPSPTPQVAIGPDDWPTYLLHAEKDGYSQAETTINATTASSINMFWSHHAGGGISTQPVVVNKTIFSGSWDGFEHATDLSGKDIWATNLGTSTNIECSPSSVGVASAATIALVTIGGTKTLLDFVGGGNGNFYALNASNGKVAWQTFLGYPPNHFIWSSPALYKGSIYIGMASLGDCPAIQGQLVQIDMLSGTIQHIFSAVPNGCLGGSIWGSPTIDSRTGEIYVATGNASACSITEIYAVSLIELHASDLTVVGSWQVPAYQQVIDSDFGSTPTLFTAKIAGVQRSMVGVINKNGIYYAFQQGAVGNGPLWSRQVSSAIGSVAPSAWDGTKLYIAGGNTTLHGKFCEGSLRALNPATGAYIWEHCFSDGRVFAAVTVVPGVVMVGVRRFFTVMDSANGNTLFQFEDKNKDTFFYGAASIAHGIIYVGNIDGNLYAFGLFARQKQTH
jgi:outer membrane protein assembly factor BamB